MNEKFDESSLNEAAINDVETARLALRWALDKIRGLHEEDLKTRQNLQEKSSQVAFLENQLKAKNSEIERGSRVHEEEMKSRQDSLEYQFRSRLERLTEREKELEDKISKSEETLKQKEVRLTEDFQKKSEELRGRWAQVEGELWQLRQEQLAKQQEFERVYGSRLEAEKKKMAEEAASQKASLELIYQNKVEELEKRERSTGDELRKQEAVLKWAKDSWQKDTEDRERALKQKDLEIDKKVLEKNQEIDDYKVKVSLLEKQMSDFPEAVRRRDEDLSRYKDALASLDSVIKTLETEKKNQQADYETRLVRTGEALEIEKNRFREMEAEIPKRLKIAVEHERNRFSEKLQEVERNYREDMGKRQDEIDYLQRNLKTFEETIKTLQTERDAFSHKVEQMQTQYSVKLEEFAFREKQLQSEYDVRLKVEMEKHTGALRSEIDTAGRIYEDSLRLKVEEIAHLRRELEEFSKDKAAAREQQAALRRELEVTQERARSDQDALRVRLKAEFEQKLSEDAVQWEKRLSAEKQRFAAEVEGRGMEFSTELGRKEEELGELRLMLQKAGEDMKMARQKAGEELKAAVAEERGRAAAELADKLSGMADTVRLRDEKIAELSRLMENSRIEREELVLMERERLQRMYAEKEKAMDEELSARDAELLRAREAVARAAADKEAAAAGRAAETRALEEKLAALSMRMAEEETGFTLKLDSALRRETDRYTEIIERKNRELEAAAQLRQAQEDGYRKTLEDFRSKLADALARFETIKKSAEEKQVQLSLLHAELAQEKKRADDQVSHLSVRLAARDKDFRDLRAEYEDFKAAFETGVKEEERKYNDVMMKLRASEEQRAAKDKQLDQIKREGEFWRMEITRKEEELSSAKSASLRALETERKELRLVHEKAAQEASQKEKEISRECALLKDALAAQEVSSAQLKSRYDSLLKTEERLKTYLEEERVQRALAETRAAESSAEAARRTEESEKTRQLVEQLKEKMKLWKTK
ncbi:MAG: hypothetical protein A2X35_04285 [Elusimicrobia bacterium GWA2_61_42]|nr:MAG: hypothetical protein A2X35_04285 [Elusimicrobia bacterium GWA2_61_42]OGR74618.1 MAG: hypothetical protein A2X38_05490 [Elusimicrobia bacterium GWC2_61_25]